MAQQKAAKAKKEPNLLMIENGEIEEENDEEAPIPDVLKLN